MAKAKGLSGADLDELNSAALVALMRAEATYDPASGAFSTHATHAIRWRIHDALKAGLRAKEEPLSGWNDAGRPERPGVDSADTMAKVERALPMCDAPAFRSMLESGRWHERATGKDASGRAACRRVVSALSRMAWLEAELTS